ncbi:MAG: transglycosylase SLT domain-containing protein [Bdellovibrio sp.]|nr:transglycosylase SLT domain-containing protein [Methylotenera sp.]
MCKLFKQTITSSLAIISLLGCFAANAFAAAGDDTFLQARSAYDKKNAIALSQHVQTLQNQSYILAPYADYWLMLLNLEDADNQTVIDFINNYSEYPFADRLRGEYLKKLAKNQDWQSFASEIVNYQLEDPAVACYAAESSAINGDVSSLAGAKSLWMQAKEQPANCSNLYDRMQAAGALTQDEVWDRFRLALAETRINLAKAIVKRANTVEAAQTKLIDKAYASPSIFINKKLLNYKTRFGRELNLFALNRIAKADSFQALSAFKNSENLMSAEDKSYFYGRLALQAAQRQEPQALQWFTLADDFDKDGTLNKDQLAWFVRTALREKNWPMVLKSVAKMPPDQAEEGAWRYWKARALTAQGQSLEANTLYAKLSTERHFYGWLAQDELKDSLSAPLNTYKVSDIEVGEIANTPAFQRAEALLRNDLKWEAKTEWAQATKGFDDKQLLAAAEFAARKNWYDLAIITADKTTEMHDYALRYPAPYRNLMKPAARDQAIDEAWVYGITRQESRFVYSAKSNVGASGLMQLMPATAKWAAKRVGMDYNHSMIHELNTNIALGTYYLRYTLDLFKGQEVMATAAYNAGPNRAKKWQASTPLEGAIYAETIPFSETRLYVQKVMANAHLYAFQLGLKSTSLKQRLGIIPGNLAAPVEDNSSPELVVEPAIDTSKPIE